MFFLLATENQDLGDQGFGPLTGVDHLFQAIAHFRPGLCSIATQLRIAEHGRQDIIEIMGDSPGKGAEGFHLLRLSQAVFPALSCG